MAVKEEEQGKRKDILKSRSWKIEKQEWIIGSRIKQNSRGRGVEEGKAGGRKNMQQDWVREGKKEEQELQKLEVPTGKWKHRRKNGTGE